MLFQTVADAAWLPLNEDVRMYAHHVVHVQMYVHHLVHVQMYVHHLTHVQMYVHYMMHDHEH